MSNRFSTCVYTVMHTIIIIFMAPHLIQAWSACKDVKIHTHTHTCMHARMKAGMHVVTYTHTPVSYTHLTLPTKVIG